MNKIETAQARLLEIVRDLEALKLQLLDMLASLPPETVQLLDVEPTDPGTEIRTVIQCVLHDSLEPAIRDLHDASAKGGAVETA